jgi:hypothetical protein
VADQTGWPLFHLGSMAILKQDEILSSLENQTLV